MSRIPRVCALIAGASLVLAAVAPSYASDEPRPRGTTESPLSSPPPLAAGLVITYEAGARPTVAAARRVVEAEGVDTAPATTPVTDGVEALAFAEPTSLAEAKSAAAELADLPGVASVEPDLVVLPAAAPPLTDPQWSKQWNIHGTYGSQAFAAWPSTTGRIVVGIVDTGRANHPDLDSKTVAGMDFISDSWRSRDGNGRDSNPADQGDWNGANECAAGIPARQSSWHGTHVAGIVGARANDGYGVASNAPGVRIQHLRVLGRCGGTMSDIAAAVRWGSGAKVPGLPRNATPARVLNLSIAGYSPSCPAVLSDAIRVARARGTVVVVAAGNEDRNAWSYSPANCAGVVTVGSTNKVGQVAGLTVSGRWVPYSNFGTALDLSAAGGDAVVGSQVLSTVNTGTTTPGGPAWGEQAGTSMAAPAVAAAAALISSHGTYSPATVEHALRWAVKPFPRLSNGRTNCSTADCGTGILDVSKLSFSTAPPVVRGSNRRGSVLTTTAGSWTGGPTSYTYRWMRNGKPIPGATGASYRIAVADGGAVVQAQVAGRKGPGSPALWRGTAGVRVAQVGTKVSLKVTPKKTRYGRSGARLVAKVRVAAGPVKGKVVFRDGKKKLKTVKVKNGKAVLKLSSTKLKRGKHKIRATYVAKHPAFKRSVSRPITLRVR
ncbi:S8 family serine peptidase [Mumia zhuanghuii]|nr:S8 family serine peptidase [Mumia zhuanghuii]